MEKLFLAQVRSIASQEMGPFSPVLLLDLSDGSLLSCYGLLSFVMLPRLGL